MNRRPRRRTAKGFSLLELMLVLVIIGALMAMAAVNLVGQGEKAKIKTTTTSMQTISSQLKVYALNENSYPQTLDVMVTGKLLEAKSLKDSFDNAFYYKAPGRVKEYDLISAGPDKQLGTADDLDIWRIEAGTTTPATR